MQRLTDEVAAKRKKNQAEIDEAKEELQRLLEEAAWKRGLQRLDDELGDAGRKGMAAAGEATVRGTFNAAALQGLMAGNTQDRIAAASEETAKNTKKLEHRARSGLAFAP
jgi:hypothetical protein